MTEQAAPELGPFTIVFQYFHIYLGKKQGYIYQCCLFITYSVHVNDPQIKHGQLLQQINSDKIKHL